MANQSPVFTAPEYLRQPENATTVASDSQEAYQANAQTDSSGFVSGMVDALNRQQEKDALNTHSANEPNIHSVNDPNTHYANKDERVGVNFENKQENQADKDSSGSLKDEKQAEQANAEPQKTEDEKSLLEKTGEVLDNFADKAQEVGKDIAVGAGEVAGEIAMGVLGIQKAHAGTMPDLHKYANGQPENQQADKDLSGSLKDDKLAEQSENQQAENKPFNPLDFDPKQDAWSRTHGAYEQVKEQTLDKEKQEDRKEDKNTNGIADTLDNLFTKAEGDYHAVNLGGKHGYKSSSRNLSEMTVKEVMAAQSRGDFNAAGHYQIIKGTLKSGVKALGLTGDEKFTPELQDRMFKEYLVGKAGGKVKLANDSTINVHGKLKDYLTGKSNDEDAALVAMAQEWASFPMPYDFKKNLVEKDNAGKPIKDEKGQKVYKEYLIKAGASFHTGSANNKANMSINEARQALREMRAMNLKYHTIK